MNMQHFPTAQKKAGWNRQLMTQKKNECTQSLISVKNVQSIHLKLFLSKTDPNAISLFRYHTGNRPIQMNLVANSRTYSLKQYEVDCMTMFTIFQVLVVF